MKGVAAIVIIHEVDAASVTRLRADIQQIAPELHTWLDDLVTARPAAAFSLRVELDDQTPTPTVVQLRGDVGRRPGRCPHHTPRGLRLAPPLDRTGSYPLRKEVHR